MLGASSDTVINGVQLTNGAVYNVVGKGMRLLVDIRFAEFFPVIGGRKILRVRHDVGCKQHLQRAFACFPASRRLSFLFKRHEKVFSRSPLSLDCPPFRGRGLQPRSPPWPLRNPCCSTVHRSVRSPVRPCPL